MIDFVNPSDLFSTGNVTLKVLADMIRDFFVQGMGMIEVNQNQIWGFGSSADLATALADGKFYDPMGASGTASPQNVPSYMYDANTPGGPATWNATGSVPATPIFRNGGIPDAMLNNKIVQQIQPLFKPVIGDGMIYTITLTNAGAGYTSPPKVRINTGGGDGAIGKLVVDLNAASATYGQITDAIVESGGAGYRSGSLTKAYLKGGGGEDGEIVCNINSGKLTSLTITNSGANYVSAPSLTFADGGTRGFITCDVAGGSIDASKLRILSRGIDYSNTPGYQPTIEFVSEDSGVTPAEATITLGNGKLIEVQVLRGGSGFKTTPTLVVTGGSSTTAACNVQGNQLDGGVVTGVTVVTPGAGYVLGDTTLGVHIDPNQTVSNSTVVATKNAVDFVFNFDFDIFQGCGVPASQKQNYKLGLFTCLYKVLPHYGHDGYGQQFYQSVSLVPKWNTALPLDNKGAGGDQVGEADYGNYTGNMTLQGERAYYISSCGALWFGNLTKFKGF